MNIETFKIKAYRLIGQLEAHIDILPQKGNKCSDCQKMCLKQALNEFEHTVNGLTKEDMTNE